MNKKINLVFIVLLLAASFIFGLSACDKNESGGAIIDEKVNKNDPIDENAKPSENYIVGEFYTLQEAYDLNLITVNDLMHISYNINGEVYKVVQGGNYNDSESWEKIDFKPTVALDVIDSETEELIKTAYYNKNIQFFKDGEGNIEYDKDILKIIFLGSYNGHYVVKVDSDKWSYGASMRTVCVGGIVWYEDGPAVTVYTIKNKLEG